MPALASRAQVQGKDLGVRVFGYEALATEVRGLTRQNIRPLAVLRWQSATVTDRLIALFHVVQENPHFDEFLDCQTIPTPK
eukprot:UN2687